MFSLKKSFYAVLTLSLAFTTLLPSALALETPYGDRSELQDSTEFYEPAQVFVEYPMHIARKGTNVIGQASVINEDSDVVSDLGYVVYVKGYAPGEELHGNPQQVYVRTPFTALPSMLPGEQHYIDYSVDVSNVPTGDYHVIVQLTDSSGRQFGWGQEEMYINNVSGEYVYVFGETIELPEFNNQNVGSLTGPNVDPDAQVFFKTMVQSANATVQVVPTLSIHQFDAVRGTISTQTFDSITVNPSTPTLLALPITTPEKAGVYTASLTMNDADGNVLSTIGEYRFVVRGAHADVLAAQITTISGTGKGDTVFVNLEYVGAADAETELTGMMKIELLDNQGIVDSVVFDGVALSDAISKGTAKLQLARDAVGDLAAKVTIMNMDGAVIGQRTSSLALSATQLESIAGKESVSMLLRWYLRPAYFITFAVLLFAVALGVAFVRWYVGLASTNARKFRAVTAWAMLIAHSFIQAPLAAAYGNGNGIEVATPRTFKQNAEYLNRVQQEYAFWKDVWNEPVVEIFVNQPLHNKPKGTYDCRGSIPIQYRVEYGACNNAVAMGRVIVRYDANGNKQNTLTGNGANWIIAHERTFQTPSANNCSTVGCIKQTSFNGNINLNQLKNGATATTLQFVVKHNPVGSLQNGMPNNAVSNNDVYFQRRFAHAVNIHLMCGDVCGDGVKGSTEQCDDGNNNNNDSCTNQCKTARCGDGFRQPGEQCDDGNGTNNDGCTNQCKLPACGDGIKQSGEQCDDGNTTNGDGCSATCENERADLTIEKTQLTPTTVDKGDEVRYRISVVNNGPTKAFDIKITDQFKDNIQFVRIDDEGSNGTCNVSANKLVCTKDQLNAGNRWNVVVTTKVTNAWDCSKKIFNVARVQSPTDFNANNNTSNTVETNVRCPAVCGDGLVNQPSEQCDDGNSNNNDSCRNNCTLPICGDGIKDTNEQCDDGNNNNTDACTNQCKLAVCGDGYKQPGEQCDDGNNNNTDACTNQCKLPVCGDGIKQAGEQCDDGNSVNTDSCTNQCKLPVCGDGYKQAGEQCDDGNTTNGDGCDSQCNVEVPAVCGDGNVDPGEQCDDGNSNNNDSCRNNCTLPICGDGIKDANEQCDDGNSNNNDSCTNQCKLPICGDGYKQPGEQCDDGNNNNLDGCTNQCTLPICGDGIKQANEQCDDGNSNNNDSCRNNCTLPICGDGIKDSNEQCDDGNSNNNDSCTNQCKLPICGDGYKQPGEQCDDGNTTNGDGCDYQCNIEVPPACGDGNVDPGEQCDDGNSNNNDSCRNNCTLPICGDGIKDANEQCDDGNSNNNDSCTNQCKLPVCGDGYKQPGEQCDDGNNNNTDACTNQCKLPVCGDGIKQAGEQCDDGNTTNGDGCSNQCIIEVPPACGDGNVDPGEQCDDGNSNNNDSCRNNCTLPICGDGIKDSNEQCDDGNSSNADSCTNQCKLPVCGDGYKQPGEQCDDGNTTNGDGCDYQCNIEVPPACGDGNVDPGEQCDDGNSNNNDSCRNNCTLPICGDGIKDSNEQCDDGNTTNGDGCSSQCVIETVQTGCIEIFKEVLDFRNGTISPAPQFTFTLDGGATVVNNSNGIARFDDVPVGLHTVTEQLTSGWEQLQVTPANGSVYVQPGTDCVGVLFKNRQIEPDIEESEHDIRVTISDEKDPVYICDDEPEYRIRVRNEGSGTEEKEVEVVARIPNDADVLDDDGGRVSGNTITWVVDLAPGDSEEFNIRLRLDEDDYSDDDDITVRVDAEYDDARETTTIRSDCDDDTNNEDAYVRINKDASQYELLAGGMVWYTITVENTGTEDANFDVVDTLYPSDAARVVSAQGGRISGNTTTWNNVRLRAGQSETFVYQAEVAPFFRGTITNTAEVRRGPNFASDTARVNAIVYLPQTGGFDGLTASMSASKNLTLVAVKQGPKVPFGMSTAGWTTVITMGMTVGAVLGRRFSLDQF